MKFIWEENDVEPGRRVQNSSKNGELIIGYRYTDDPKLTQPAIITVVSLDDGLEVFHATTSEVKAPILAQGSTMVVGSTVATWTGRAHVADWLNKSGALPLTLGLR